MAIGPGLPFPVETVRKLKELVLDEPWSIRYCLRIIPIEETVKTTISEIEEKITTNFEPPVTQTSMSTQIVNQVI